MNMAEDLREKYTQLISEPLGYNGSTPDDLHISTLLQTDCVRILVLRDTLRNDELSIEVEGYLPDFSKNAGSESETSIKGYKDSKQLALRLIDQLKYLIGLDDLGFDLSFEGPDYLWTANYCPVGIPTSDFFEKLLPPP